MPHSRTTSPRPGTRARAEGPRNSQSPWPNMPRPHHHHSHAPPRPRAIHKLARVATSHPPWHSSTSYGDLSPVATCRTKDPSSTRNTLTRRDTRLGQHCRSSGRARLLPASATASPVPSPSPVNRRPKGCFSCPSTLPWRPKPPATTGTRTAVHIAPLPSNTRTTWSLLSQAASLHCTR